MRLEREQSGIERERERERERELCERESERVNERERKREREKAASNECGLYATTRRARPTIRKNTCMNDERKKEREIETR